MCWRGAVRALRLGLPEPDPEGEEPSRRHSSEQIVARLACPREDDEQLLAGTDREEAKPRHRQRGPTVGTGRLLGLGDVRAVNAPEAQPFIDGAYRKGWELPV
jgi:hypothetical protein